MLYRRLLQLLRHFLAFIVALAAIGLSGIHLFGQISPDFSAEEIPKLKVNASLSRQMGKRETHLYSFDGEAGKCLNLLVEQQGTDVAVSLFSPSGKRLARVERSNALLGPERMTFILPSDGVYTVKLESNSWVEIENGYTIVLKPFSIPNEKDSKRIRAEDLVSEGDRLSFSKDSADRLASAECFRDSIAIWQELGEQYETMVAYYGLGWSYFNQNEFEDAADTFATAVDLARLSQEKYMLGHSLRGYANAHFRLGENASALISGEESVQIFRSLKMQRYVAFGLQTLGYAQYGIEDFNAALESFNEALNLRKIVGDRNGELLTLAALAKTHSRLGSYQQAFEFVESALALSAAEMDATKAEIYSEGGWVLIALERYSDARSFFTKALGFYERSDSPSGQAIALCGLGMVERGAGDLRKALNLVERSLAMIEVLRQRVSDTAFRMSFSASNQSYYEIYVNLLMELHRSFPSEGFDAKAFSASEKARARVLLDVVSDSEELNGNYGSPNTKSRAKELQMKYISLLKDWKTYRRAKDRSGAASVANYLQKTIREKRKLELEAKVRGEKEEKLKPFEYYSNEKIRALLDDDTILLEFGLFRNSYGKENSYVWAVTNKFVKGFDLPPRKLIEEKVEKAYGLITARNEHSGITNRNSAAANIAAADKAFEAVSRELGLTLLGPIAKQNLLESKKRILIVSNGILQSLPFSVVADPSSENEKEYLISNYELVTIPSASILVALNERRQNRELPLTSALVFADPVFSAADERFGESTVKTRASLSDYFTQTELPRLFNTRFEAEKISSYLPPAEKQIALDFDATVNSITKRDLTKFRIIHLATHAFIDDETPELSGIAFSMFDEKRQPIDGVLLSGDIMDLKVNADLVVLSGCRTGLGKPVRGEGLVGLTQSFMYAGASGVLSSLWSVDDRATAQLMANFYKYRFGSKMSYSAALRQAKLEMIKTPRWQSPYFWAAFTLQGDF